MNCTDARAALPLLLYDEASPQERAALRDHLAGCAACRREHDELQRIRRLLDAAPVPHVEVDLARLHETLADRQTRRLRRWRRVALTLGAVAACLLLAAGLRLEVRLEAGQMVVRWGAVPPPAPSAATSVPPVVDLDRRDASSSALTEAEAELRVLRELIHALKRDGDDREERFQERLDRLQAHVRILQAQADRRWSATEQDVAALYLLTRKGEKP